MTTILLAVWVVALGACLGSFLNVVIYRLPRRISLSWPGSHCPACKRPIRWYDNLPVAGWLKLGGRCRDCGAAISARYPAVEALVAALALLLATVDVFWIAGEWPPPIAAAPLDPALWGRLFFHLLLVCTLVAAAFMVHDGESPPLRLFAPALLVGLIAPAIWDGLRPVGAVWPLSTWMAGTPWQTAALEGASGLLAGGLAALLAWPALGLPRAQLRDYVAGKTALVTTGVCLGWQATGVVAAAAMLLVVLWALFSRVGRRVPPVNPLAALAIAAVAWLLGTPWTESALPELGGRPELARIVVPGVCIAVASLAARLLVRDESSLKSKARA